MSIPIRRHQEIPDGGLLYSVIARRLVILRDMAFVIFVDVIRPLRCDSVGERDAISRILDIADYC
jgi:hypothetical protein